MHPLLPGFFTESRAATAVGTSILCSLKDAKIVTSGATLEREVKLSVD